MRSTRLNIVASVAAACVMAMLVAQPSQAQTYEVLHAFGGARGSTPAAGVILDGKGNIYGTTFHGGAYGNGTVYKLSLAGKETLLYSFTGGADGGNPQAVLTQDANGNLYGTTTNGGDSSCFLGQGSGCGTVFKLSVTGKETVLYSFTGGAYGAFPQGVIQDAEGNLYGTTFEGGSYGGGTVFKVSKTGQETVLYSFTGRTDGDAPFAGVIRDAQGNLYGTTRFGGDLTCPGGGGCGTVFKLSSAGKETVLYSFTGGADGSQPIAGVIRDAEGNLYGTTLIGGDLSACSLNGCGVVFKLSKTGKETVLYRFKGAPDGADPVAGVIRDAKGNLYGTTYSGGVSNVGTAFELSWMGKETVLFSFENNARDGYSPRAGVIQDTEGNLYGATADGGRINNGVAFKLMP